MAPYGSFERIDGRGALVFRREFDVPLPDTWAAVTTPAGLAAWFPCRVDGDLTTAGAGLDFVFAEEDPDGAEATHGTVLVVAPERRLTFTWETEELRFGLGPRGEDGCVLSFVHLLPGDDDSTAARTAAGWHACLGALGEYLATGAVAPPPPDPTAQFRALYDHYLTAGFPSGAPLPGDDDA